MRGVVLGLQTLSLSTVLPGSKLAKNLSSGPNLGVERGAEVGGVGKLSKASRRQMSGLGRIDLHF